jgi:hypothetical protein
MNFFQVSLFLAMNQDFVVCTRILGLYWSFNNNKTC